MAKQNADYPNQIITTNPPGTDQFREGDDNLRNAFHIIAGTWPNHGGPVVRTHDEINAMYGPHNPPPATDPTTPIPTVHLFTANGTWTKPSTDVVYIVVEVQGGGGGGSPDVGGSNGNGGAGGGYARKIIDVTGIANASIVVAGAAATGVDGQNSSYDDGTNQVTGQGGQGGQISSSNNYDATPGNGVGGDINIRGGYGKSRHGGDSFTGYGGGVNGGGPNVEGHNGYSGGGGGGATDDVGGTGGSGFVKITEFYRIGS